MDSGILFSMVSVIMPILVSVIILVIAILIIIVFYKTKKAQSLSLQAFEELAQELRTDNKIMKSDLEAIKGTLDSINKMMEEI